MSYDIVFLHPPSIVDHARKPWFPGPIARTVRAMSPLFIMVPMGVLSMADRLLKNGYKTKIMNLGEKSLESPASKLEETIRSVESEIFAIDLHWDVHACGAIETASICKRQHPNSFVLLGGLTASCFSREIVSSYDSVDGVIRGEAEEAVTVLTGKLKKGQDLREVPNLCYREPDGRIRINKQAKPSESIDEYSFTNLKLIEPKHLLVNGPLSGKGLKWWHLPVCRGCTHNCVTCGGSEYAYHNILGRETPAFRRPERMVEDFKELDDQGINCIFLFQDCRMGTKTYYQDLLRSLHRERWSSIEHVALELFDPIDDELLRCLNANKPADSVSLTMSPESGSESVRYFHGRSYTNESILRTLSKCAENLLPIDFHFMVGLGTESCDSLNETWALWEKILTKNRSPEFFTSVDFGPMILLDPGSIAFDHPQKFGYKLLATNFSETYERLSGPLWVDWMNYETKYMSKADLVDSIFRSTSTLIGFFEKYGICDKRAADNERIKLDIERRLTKDVQDTLRIADRERRLERLRELGEIYRDPLLSYSYLMTSD